MNFDDNDDVFGNRVLAFEESEKRHPEPKHEEIHSPINSSVRNPYLRARIALLEKMSPKSRNEIKRWEETGDINHHLYENFCHEVAVLGDKFSN